MHRRFTKRPGFDSNQEVDFNDANPSVKMKPMALPYTQNLSYLPDAMLGVTPGGKRVYVELKEYIAVRDCAKYEAVVNSNSNVILCMLILSAADAVFTRLAKHPQIFVSQGYSELPLLWRELCNGS